MKEAAIIFPTQLFSDHPCLGNARHVFLVEEPRYFTDFQFHKKKLILHRASMKAYQEMLEKRGHAVTYIDYAKDWRSRTNGSRVCAVRPYDRTLEGRLPEGIVLEDSPGFLGGEITRSRRYMMGHFYRRQRRRLGILMDGDDPVGGKWSFDDENRKPLKKGHKVPPLKGSTDRHIKDAVGWVEEHFPDNPGKSEGFFYPVTHAGARRWLRQFVDERLESFGDYEDAIAADEDFLYHSVLSPLLNIGLLTPPEVVDAVMGADVAINSKEGFIRQVIGWREFILQIYLLEGERQRGSNFFGHRKKLPDTFYSATTGILPVDNVIGKVLKNAYAHHIERLMVLSNHMLLSGYAPHEIYRWFMEMFIDAYDWVMVPNVYGMAQFADGGLMSTKPYISSSNYILKMSDFRKGGWCETWDEQFWSFLKRHRKKLATNPRMALLLRKLDG